MYFEYVVAVADGDSNEILNKVIETDGDIIVWHSPITGKEELSLGIPSKEIDQRIRTSMVHKEKSLLRKLRKARTSRKMFNIFPQGHPCSKLCSLTSVIQNTEEGKVITKQRLLRTVEQDLFYLKEEDLEKEVNQVIKQAIEINFLKAGPDQNTYKLISDRKTVQSLEKELEQKWTKKAIDDIKLDCMPETTLRDFLPSDS